MYTHPQPNAAMAPPQKPETFMLSDAAQQSLPQDAQVALQQVDNRKCASFVTPIVQDIRYQVVADTTTSEILPDICTG